MAAGVSARCGRNKLMVNVQGKPLFLKSVEAAIKSKASPVFIVTGYQSELMEEYLDNIDINVLHNSEYRSGIKTSISLGLKSVPNFCDGAILIPADMPNIKVEHINNLINNFDKKKNKQVIISEYNHKKTNPILWSKALYNVADIVPENAELRAVFVEHSDYMLACENATQTEILDITYPLDLEEYEKSQNVKNKK